MFWADCAPPDELAELKLLCGKVLDMLEFDRSLVDPFIAAEGVAVAFVAFILAVAFGAVMFAVASVMFAVEFPCEVAFPSSF